MAWSAVESEPPRGAIQNLKTGEIFRFQFNPPDFTETFDANYARHNIPGLGYQVLQYINTNNNIIKLQLYLSKVAQRNQILAAPPSANQPSPELGGSPSYNVPNFGKATPYPVDSVKRFLQSLLYPVRSESGGWQAPPLLLFIWPEVVRATCVLTTLSYNHQRFSTKTLGTVALTADVSLEVVSDFQVFSDFVQRRGTSST